MANQPFDVSKNIIARLGLESLPEERRVKLLDRLTDLVQKRVLLRLIESLGEADAAAAEKLIDQPDELMSFLGSRVGDVGAIIEDETEKLKNELVLGASVDEAAA